MTIQVNRQSGTPLYLQIADQVKYLIATGGLQPGERLPSVRQLAADLGVNFNTVAHAYKELGESPPNWAWAVSSLTSPISCHWLRGAESC